MTACLMIFMLHKVNEIAVSVLPLRFCFYTV
jgi:hypothetical protein